MKLAPAVLHIFLSIRRAHIELKWTREVGPFSPLFHLSLRATLQYGHMNRTCTLVVSPYKEGHILR